MGAIKVISNYSIAASPMNYIGGKAKLLPQILPLFPSQIEKFYDVFGGGANVAVNIDASKLIVNDINHYVIEILEQFYKQPIDELIAEIERYIAEYELTKTNREGFLALRKSYNEQPDPIKLYTLICFSFNYQFRFNNNHEYNNPFGNARSHFSERLRQKLIRFSAKLQKKNIIFTRLEFQTLLAESPFGEDDLVYLDPPYLITTGSYNDGNRGFIDWTHKQENLLHNELDSLNQRGVKFALSNVLEHKGATNELLVSWLSRNSYKVHHLENCYRNSSHNTTRKSSTEVLITNYP